MLWGETEIDMFLAATGMQSANVNRLPTYPSKNPYRHLDFVLHSKGIKVRADRKGDVVTVSGLALMI